MFECDEDLGLDDELFTQENLDHISEISNKTNETDQESLVDRSHLGSSSKQDDKQENRLTLESTPSRKINQPSLTPKTIAYQGNCVVNEKNECEKTPGKNIDLWKEGDNSESWRQNDELRESFEKHNFTRPVSREKYFVHNESNNSAKNSVNGSFEDDHSDVFTDDITFDVEEERIIKRPKVPDKKNSTPGKRKFPGPAGILPESPICLKSFYEHEDRDEAQSSDISNTQDFPCTQDNTQFSGQLWLKMCSDFRDGPVFLPDCYNIASIKSQAKSKAVHGCKFPFLAAIIIHVKKFDSKTLNTVVTLKDATGRINASLQPDLYEVHKQDITVGSVIILRDFSVLALNTSANIYITITMKNLLFIYSAAGLRQSSQTQRESTQFTAPKVTNVQDVTIKSVIEDTLQFNNYSYIPCQGNNSRYIQACNVQNKHSVQKRESWCNKQNTEFYDITDAEKQCLLSDDFGDLEELFSNENGVQSTKTVKRKLCDEIPVSKKKIQGCTANPQKLSSDSYIIPTTSTYQQKLNKNNYQNNKTSQIQLDRSSNVANNSINSNPYNNTANGFISRDNPNANKQKINFTKLNIANKPCSSREVNVNDGCVITRNQVNYWDDNKTTYHDLIDEFISDDKIVKHNQHEALIHSEDRSSCNKQPSEYNKLSKIDININEQNCEETNKKINRFNQFRFKKRISDEKENNKEDSLENNNPHVNKTNAEIITSTQISVLSEDQEHSQILEEVFDGIDACSLFEEF